MFHEHHGHAGFYEHHGVVKDLSVHFIHLYKSVNFDITAIFTQLYNFNRIFFLGIKIDVITRYSTVITVKTNHANSDFLIKVCLISHVKNRKKRGVKVSNDKRE